MEGRARLSSSPHGRPSVGVGSGIGYVICSDVDRIVGKGAIMQFAVVARNVAVIGALLLAAAVGLAASSDASAADVRCDFCWQEWDYSEQARYLGDGQHVIYNLSSFQAHSFLVEGWGEAPIELDKPGVTVTPLGQVWKNELGHLKVASEETGGTMTAMAAVDLEDLGISQIPTGTTAYEIVRNPEYKSRIEQYLNSRAVPGISAKFSTAFQAIRTGAMAALFGSEISIRVEVVTSDGKVVFRKTASADRYRYQAGQSIGMSGHFIPEDLSAASGAAWVSQGGDDLDSMWDHLMAMGATLVIGADSEGGGCSNIERIASVTVRDADGNIIGQHFELTLLC